MSQPTRKLFREVATAIATAKISTEARHHLANSIGIAFAKASPTFDMSKWLNACHAGTAGFPNPLTKPPTKP